VNAPNFASESRVTERWPRPFHTVFHNTPPSPVSSASPRHCLLTAVLRSPPHPSSTRLLFLSPFHLPCSLCPPHSSPLTRGFWFLAATTGRAAPPLRRVFVGPFRRRRAPTRYARPFASLRFPSCSARPSAPNPK
jgi:hypothetical protein